LVGAERIAGRVDAVRALRAAVPAVDEAPDARPTLLAVAALIVARAAATLRARRVDAPVRSERVLGARIVIVAATDEGVDRAADAERAVVPAVVEIVRVAVVALLVAFDETVPALRGRRE